MRFIASYLVVGFVGFCANMLVLTVALKMGVAVKVAIIQGIVTSTLLNFILDRHVVFPHARHRALAGQFIGFILVCLLGALVNYIVALSLLFLFFPQLAELFGIIVGTSFNYVLLRFVVFKR